MTKKEEENLFSKSYVQVAEESVRLLKEKEEKETQDYKKVKYFVKKYDFKITTTQIRKLLSILNETYSYVVSMPSVAEEKDMEKRNEVIRNNTETLKEKMQYFKMRCIYESGRDEYWDTKKTTGVHDFVYRTRILIYLDEFDKITDYEELRKAFIWIFHYMESLVAYHRFLGGKDNER